MATGFGTGFDINALDAAIKKAEQGIDRLVSRGTSMESSITNNFKNIAKNGVGDFINKLNEAKQVISSLGISSGGKSGIANIVDDVNRLTQSLGKTSSSNGLETIDKAMQSLMERIKMLSGEIKTFKSFEGGNLLNTEDYRRIGEVSDQLNILMKQYEALHNTRLKLQQQGDLFKDHIDNINGVSVSARKQKSELDKLNQAYKTGTSELHKKAKAEDDATKNAIAKTRKLTEEYERQAKAKREAEYKKNTSYQGAIDFSSRANSINREMLAIKYLTEARRNLSKADSDYQNKLNTLNDKIKAHILSIKEAVKGSKELREKHRSLMDTSGQLARALAGVFSVSAIKGYINKIVEVRGEFELQHKSLQVLIQDVDKANKLWDKTVSLAVKSPFRVKDLVTYTKQLAAYRVETDKLYDTTKMLADVSSGLGVDMNRLILAYGQVKAANFLRGTELRQFTEAGIPMLDELAKYFSEIENRAVSAADVFNRISKRGVSFEDVDAVFQRITGEGGVFYKMQEKQSETLKGMINNLRDSLDLMMNDIGQSQEGALKGMISATKDIVDNWRAIAVAIKQVGSAIAIMGLKNLVGGWKAVSLATFEGTSAMSGAAKAGATLRLSLQKLFATMTRHPLAIVFAAIGAGVHALWSYHKALKEVNKQYDEASASEMRRLDTLKKVGNDIEKNNTIIKNSKLSQEEHNEAIAENKSILERLKKEYPNIYSSIKVQENGTIDLTEALKKQNEELRINIALQQQAKGRFFQESQTKNYKDVLEAQSKLQSAIYDTQSAAITMGSKLEYAIQQGRISEEDAKGIKDYIEAIKSANNFEEVQEAFLNKDVEGKIEPSVAWKIGLRHVANAYYDALAASGKYERAVLNFQETLDNQMSTFKVELTKMESTFEEGLDDKEKELKRGEWLQKQLESLNILDEEIQKLSKDYIVTKIGFQIEFPEPSQDDPKLKAWQKTYNKLFGIADDAKTKDIDESFSGFKKITNEATTQAQEIERLQAEYKSVKELIDAINKAGGVSATLQYGAYEGEDLSLLKSNLEDIMAQLDFFGADYEKKKDDEALQRLKKQISLIREAARAYDDMRKLHDKAYAYEQIVKEYGPAFKEAQLGDISGYAFGTRQDEQNNLEKLRASAGKTTDGVLELNKAIAQVGVNIADADQEILDKKLFDSISDIFSNYEISLEMDKLNIPKDLAKRLFGLEAIDLKELRPAILEKFGLQGMRGMSSAQIYESEAFKSMSDARRKELKEALDKEARMEEDARMDRLKTYSQYLVKEQHERIKFKMEEIRKIAEIDAMSEFNEDEKEVMKGNVHREYNEKMAKSYWEDFEKSPMFVNLFDDMELATKQSLNNMKTHLESMRDSMIAAGLPASDLKEILDKINQVEKELEERNPFSGLKSLGAIMFGTGGDSTVSRKEFKEAKSNEGTYLANAETLKTQEGAALRLYETQKATLQIEEDKLKGLHKGSKEYEEQRQKVDILRAGVSAANKSHQNIVKEIEENNKKLNQAQSTTKQWKEQVKDVGDGFVFVKNAVNQIGGALSTALQQTGLMGEEDAAIFDSAMNVANSALGLGASIASGDIVGIITNGLSLIGNIAATGDAVRQKAINAELEKAKNAEKIYENLEKKYAKLQKTMEKAIDISTMDKTKKEMDGNIDAQNSAIDEQIKALERANAIESENKKVDQAAIDANNQKIEELKAQKEELADKQEELNQQFIETLGGSYDYTSAAEQFLDAWITAFEETGDGMKGLEDSFDDFWKSVLKKQVVYGGASEIIKSYMDKINDSLSDGTLDDMEIKDIEEKEEKTKQKLNDFYKWANEKYGLAEFDSEADTLSGLQAGIQGITEEQANILEAYWNAVRFSAASIDAKMDRTIALTETLLRDVAENSKENPIVGQLKLIQMNTRDILTILQNVTNSSSDVYFNIRT